MLSTSPCLTSELRQVVMGNFPWSSMAPVVQRAGQVFDA